jgi:hypothetical protein
MTRPHLTLFILRSGHSGLGIYTTRRSAAGQCAVDRIKKSKDVLSGFTINKTMFRIGYSVKTFGNAFMRGKFYSATKATGYTRAFSLAEFMIRLD